MREQGLGKGAPWEINCEAIGGQGGCKTFDEARRVKREVLQLAA
jgi:hypothetical protein